jgi:biopolymer transport protein ExbD
VIKVMEAAKRNKIENIEFALGAKPPVGADEPGKDSDPHQAPTSREREPSTTKGSASRSSRPNDKSGDPQTITLRVVHRDVGDTFSCDTLQKNLACYEDSHWMVQVGGKAFTWGTVKAKLQEEALLEWRQPLKPDQPVRLADRRVLIHADPRARYGHVVFVIEACGSVGLHKIEVGQGSSPAAK